MSTLDFFDYLASNEATHDLALELADVWTERQLASSSPPEHSATELRPAIRRDSVAGQPGLRFAAGVRP